MARDAAQLERIKQEQQEALFAYITSHDADVHGVPYDERLARFDDYANNHKASYKDGVKLITFRDFPDLLALANMTVRDVYNLWGVELSWPDEAAERMYNNLITISEKDRPKFVSFIHGFARNSRADFFSSQDVKRFSPTRRITACRSRFYGIREWDIIDARFKEIDEDIALTIDDRHKARRIDPKFYPACANALDVSLKWVIDLPNTSGCWTSNLAVDNAMSEYLLCRNTGRRKLDAIVQSFFEKEEN